MKDNGIKFIKEEDAEDEEECDCEETGECSCDNCDCESSEKDSEEDSEEEGEEQEIDVLEFAVNDEEIDELIKSLQELKATKESFGFAVDEETEIVIHHDDNFEEEGEEE